MPPEHHTYNQSEIDRMHAIRTISDAEFLSDKGTEYVNDQLIVTPEQIAMAADKEAPRDKKVAAYALRDVLHVELEKTSADYECESTNRYNLSTEIEKVTEHYRGQHADKLPPVTSNKRSLFGDKLKTKIMTAKLRDAEEIIGSFDAKLKTTLSYTQGEKHNSLVKSVMQITDRVNPAYDPKYEPALEINYTHGKIDSINFYRLITGGTMFNAMLGDTELAPNPLGEFYKKTTGCNGRHEYDTSLVLEGRTPGIKVMPEGTGEGFEYRYDAGANVFRRIGPQIITERGVDEHRERPGKLSVVEFADIVAGALALTPKM